MKDVKISKRSKSTDEIKKSNKLIKKRYAFSYINN